MAKITKEVAELLFDTNKILIGETDGITLKDARLLTSKQAVKKTMDFLIGAKIMDWNCYCFENFGENPNPFTVTYLNKKGFFTACTYYNQELKERKEMEMEEKIKEIQQELDKRNEIEEKAISLMGQLKFDEANKLLSTLNESDNLLKNFLDE